MGKCACHVVVKDNHDFPDTCIMPSPFFPEAKLLLHGKRQSSSRAMCTGNLITHAYPYKETVHLKVSNNITLATWQTQPYSQCMIDAKLSFLLINSIFFKLVIKIFKSDKHPYPFILGFPPTINRLFILSTFHFKMLIVQIYSHPFPSNKIRKILFDGREQLFTD